MFPQYFVHKTNRPPITLQYTYTHGVPPPDPGFLKEACFIPISPIVPSMAHKKTSTNVYEINKSHFRMPKIHLPWMFYQIIEGSSGRKVQMGPTYLGRIFASSNGLGKNRRANEVYAPFLTAPHCAAPDTEPR